MLVLIRGGGDLATGVAVRLIHAGLRVVITELPYPLAVRRSVAFAQAVFEGETVVEGLRARRITDAEDTLRVLQVLSKGQVPVLVDPDAHAAQTLHPTVIVDARLIKRAPEPLKHQAALFIGLGPGFIAGSNCHAVVETNRGHALGRVIWQGSAEADTRLPESVGGYVAARVLRSPIDGILVSNFEIGAHVDQGQVVADVSGVQVIAPFSGMLRGMIYSGSEVKQGQKIGDLDPRDDPRYCSMVSDKALAVGGGVVEAILTRSELRPLLWK